jgi:hypothetical protein
MKKFMPTESRHTWALLFCAVTAGCSLNWERSISDGPTEAGVGDAATDALAHPDSHDGETSGEPPITLVQSGQNARDNGTTVSVTIAATSAGNLLVVGVSQDQTAGAQVASVHDDAPGGGNTYVSANERSVDGAASDSAEIWYAKNVVPGAQTITVTMSVSTSIEAWVAEFSGLSDVSPLDKGAVAAEGGGTVSAPLVMPSVPRALLVSLATVYGYITGPGAAAGGPFVDLALQNGNDLAYYVASVSGSYGATWDGFLTSWNASTVSFK